MAAKYWQGRADAAAQVGTGSIDSVDGTPANNTFTVTIGGVAISAVGDTDVATTATNLRVSLNASSHPYFAAITWSGATGDIIGTADTAGVPFVAALTETGAGTGAVTDFAATTASSGPNDWSTADNWSDGSVPGASDDVTVPNGGPAICWGLDQNAVTLDSLTVEKGAGSIGLDSNRFATDSDGDTFSTTTKPEYREGYLKIGATAVGIGEDFGPSISWSSGRIMLNNVKAGASDTVIHDSPVLSSDSGKPAIRLDAAHASADLYVRSAPGGVGVAYDQPGETATIGDVYVSDDSTASKVFVGEGVTLTQFEQDGGANILQAAATVTAVTVNGGTLTLEGDYTITTLTMEGGTCNDNHVKTAGNAVTTATLNGGTLDLSGSAQARTLATVNLNPGATLATDSGIVTITTLNETGGPVTLAAT